MKTAHGKLPVAALLLTITALGVSASRPTPEMTQVPGRVTVERAAPEGDGTFQKEHRKHQHDQRFPLTRLA